MSVEALFRVRIKNNVRDRSQTGLNRSKNGPKIIKNRSGPHEKPVQTGFILVWTGLRIFDFFR